MEKGKLNKNGWHLKRKQNEERLEISSTGYGLESVSSETAEDTKQNNNPSCGGL